MYNPKVAEMHAEFAAQGLHNELLDAFYKDPHNLAGIRMIAEAIGGMFGLAYQVKN